jgi:hypothetical protein
MRLVSDISDPCVMQNAHNIDMSGSVTLSPASGERRDALVGPMEPVQHPSTAPNFAQYAEH